MPLATWYGAGTISVTGGSTTVTGTSVAWGDGAILLGDLLYLPSQPLIPPQRVESATDTELELAVPWPGATAVDADYEIRYASIIERSTAQTREVLEDLSVLRANTRGLFYNFVGNAPDENPGAGDVAVNNADPALVTEIYASTTDANRTGRNVQPLIELWSPGTILIFRSFETTAYVAYQIATVQNETGYVRVNVSFIGMAGSLIEEPISVEWVITGEGINIGAAGTFAGRSAYDGQPAGFVYLSTDGNGSSNLTPSLYRKNSATSGDWSAQIPFQGPMGYRGWSPVYAYEDRSGGAESVARLLDWVGGEGPKPTAGIGQYIGTTGFVATAAEALNIKGVRGDPMGIRLTMAGMANTDPPPAGGFRTNSTVFGSITELRFPLSPTDNAGSTISGWFQSLDDVINSVSRGTLRFQSTVDPAVYMEFRVTGAISSQPNYQVLPVAPIAGARPAAATTFAAYFAPSGRDGANGLDGTDPGALYNWDVATADANPGAGNIRADNSALPSATQLFVSKTGRNGEDLAPWLATFGASTNPVKGSITLTRPGGTAQAIFDVTGVTDATGYVKLAVTDNSGSTGFLAAEPISLQFTRYGDQGSADATSVASAINAAPVVTSPDPGVAFAVTDPATGNLLGQVSFATLQTAIQPPSGVVENKTANYTVVVADRNKTITVDATAAARTIAIDPVTTFANGDAFTIKKVDTSTNVVTIDASMAETIDGALTLVLRSPGQSVTLKSNGTAWVIVNDGSVGTNPQVQSNISILSLNLSDALGSRLGMRGGVADAFNDETGINAVTSLNETYDAVNNWYAPAVGGGTQVNVGTFSSNNTDGSAYVYIDRGTAVLNSVTISSLGVYSVYAGNFTLWIVRRDSAGVYTFLSSVDIAHTGSGLEFAVLSVPYAVPASGTFYIASRMNAGNISKTASKTRSYKVGGASAGSNTGFTEDTGTIPPLSYIHSQTTQNMTLISVSYASGSAPSVGRILVQINTAGSPSPNTDFDAAVSRDGGTTWTSVSLTQVSAIGNVKTFDSENTSIASQPSGSSLLFRIRTLTGLNIPISGVVLQWA